MKKVVYISLTLLLVAASTAFFLYTRVYNKPHKDILGTDASYTVSAEEILEEFMSHEDHANQRFLDKIVRITGEIQSIETANGMAVLTLGSGEGSGGVICNMDPSENKRILELKVGQELEVKGICTGYLMDVVIVRAVIVNQI
ncbi:MAG TPA: hypothetical protein VKZ56_00070 [Membranihabitans sp.]|nr:hypothetical protein [Membranihabitans sp.]